MNQALGGVFVPLINNNFICRSLYQFYTNFYNCNESSNITSVIWCFTILMYLIKNNSASKTVSIFFLIPATSAFMAWLFLNESLTNLDLLGF